MNEVAKMTQQKPVVSAGVERPQGEQIRQRQLARTIALQAMYEIDSVGHTPGTVVDSRLTVENPGEHGIQYLRWLVAGVVANRVELDALITRHAPEFPIDQLALIDRNILRLGLFELGSKSADVPPKVVINEAVELAKLFGGDGTPRFVNGVLGAALNEVFRKVF